MGPDSRVLITKARKIAQKYMLTYGEPIPANQLVREIASVMQVSSCPLQSWLPCAMRLVRFAGYACLADFQKGC
jgi:20S proteasome alpha/beta subunit